jgi:hypothetical protein
MSVATIFVFANLLVAAAHRADWVLLRGIICS